MSRCLASWGDTRLRSGAGAVPAAWLPPALRQPADQLVERQVEQVGLLRGSTITLVTFGVDLCMVSM